MCYIKRSLLVCALVFAIIPVITWSSQSALASAPVAPTNLTAVPTSTTEVNLTWTDQSTDEKGFKIFQSLDGIKFKKAGKVKSDITTFSISSLNPDSTYYYKVRVYNSNGKSETNIISTKTQPVPVSVSPKAFPGAVGFGTETPAGRGGAVLRVTNLNDSGAGSFRSAVEATGARIVVFEVSGTIQLLSELDIREPFLTVAGQTAPNPGITLRAVEFNINTHDVLVQHIRIRVGDQLPAGTDPGSLDGLSSDGSYTGGAGSYNIVMDHVSVSWAIDENASSWGGDVHDITFSNCIISEALYASLHPKGPHSMGMLIAPNARNVAIVGNLFVHNADRNPLISVGASVVMTNNVFYNWMGGRATGIGNTVSVWPALYPTLVSVVENAYIAGPNTIPSTNAISTTTTLNAGSMIYYSNNYIENVGTEFRNQATFDPVVSTPPISIPGFTPAPAASLVDTLILTVGARPLNRDDVDIRVTNNVLLRNGQIINSPSEVGGWPPLTQNTRALTIPADPSGDDDHDGYTNVEEQLLFPMAALME